MARPLSKQGKLKRRLAARYKCDQRTIAEWMKAGAPFNNPKEMDVWIASRKSGNGELDPVDIKQAKLAKINAETQRILFRLRVDKSEYTANSEVARDAAACGAMVRAEIMALENEGPTWAGLSPAEIQDKCKAFIRAMLGRLRMEA